MNSVLKFAPLSPHYVRHLPYTKTHFSCNEKCWSCYTRRVQGAGKNLQSEFLGSPLGELSSVSETKGGFSKLIYQSLSKATLVSSCFAGL